MHSFFEAQFLKTAFCFCLKCLIFPKTTFVCFLKCLSVRFSPNCICFLKFVHSFFEARFLKIAFCFFLKCLPVCFFSKMYFAVFGNVCLFVVHQTAFAFFFKCLSFRFLNSKLDFSKLNFAFFRNVCPFVLSPKCILMFFKMFVRSFFSKLHLLFFLKSLSIRSF